MSEGGWTAGQRDLPGGRGKGLCCLLPLGLPPTVKSTSAGDAHKVCLHLFWLVRKAQNWRGQRVGRVGTGRDRKDPVQRHARPALGTAALGAPRLPSSSPITRFVAGLLMMQLSSSGGHLF